MFGDGHTTRRYVASPRYRSSARGIMCAPHTCVCGVQVGGDGAHGLACRKSAGRQMSHNAVNDLIKRALVSANVPSLLEPNSFCRDDGKRPDGLIVLPWANGRCLVWDFTCPDTLAASYFNRAVLGSGVVANDAESRKSTDSFQLRLRHWVCRATKRRHSSMSAHCSCHSWTTFILVPDATSECCNTTWQCSLHHRNCWLGRTFYI